MQKGKASASPPAMVFQGRPPVQDIRPGRSPSSQQSEVPPEIVTGGSVALETYNKALAEGKTLDNRVPVMLIGQDRSGKTSLKKSLRGEPFNPHEESTVGIDVDPSLFRVSTEIWKAGEKDQEDIFAVLWDFAGQSVYYATHPLFLTSRAMYLLVYDLSQNPCEIAKPVVKQGVYRKFEDSFGMKTNLDYLDFWMSSIASLACQNESGPICSNSEVLPEKLPPVFLVCTHADSPYNGGDPNTLARELFGSLQTKPYNKHLHDVFVVDNTKSGLKSECPEVVRLRNEVLAIAKELPQMNETIPIKWLKFEKELQAASEEGCKWISFKTAASIASEKCNVVDSFEFQTLLNFLHDKRILIHFDDTPELNELVVLDPQWLIDVFKKVITVKPYDPQGKKFTELWRKLENKGILDEKLLEQVWGPLFDDRATCEKLLQIMGKFSLLCPWPSSDSLCGKQYLVPAMLRTHPPGHIMKLVEVASKTIPPLFLKFESGQVPPGLFPRLVLLFLQCGEEILLIPERTKLFHNCARFFTSEEVNWSVILLCLSSSIKVVVHRENPMTLSADPSYGPSDMTFPCKVRRQLGMILTSMRNEFYWLKYVRYEASFICPVCCQGGALRYRCAHVVQDCKQEECLHFWSLSQLCNAKRILSCIKAVDGVNGRVETVQFTPWFTTLGNQLTTDQHDGENLTPVEVPPEIVVRGRLALEAYNKALAEGKTFDNRVPVMLIGQDRSGKTSLKRSLMGETFKRDLESTVGIDADPSLFQVSTEIWKAGEKDQEATKTSISFEYHAARATVENLKQGKSVLEEKIPMGSTDYISASSASYSSVSDVSSTIGQNPPPPMGTTALANSDFISVPPASYSYVSDVSSTSTQAPQSPMDTTVSPASYSSVPDVSMDSELGSNIQNIPKDIENEMLKRIQNDQEMEDKEGIYSVLWDFAGQVVYYATHPLFLTSRAIYLLVNDLSQNPSETAKPVVMQGVYEQFEDSFGMKTNLDYLDFWMSSIASLACQNQSGPIYSNSEVLPEKLPPVFLVCTHADRPYNGGDRDKLTRELFGYLQTKPYNKHLHDVFVVDNTKSGLESECPEVVRLRNEVLAIAKELPQMKEAIPIKWLKFEKELRAMCEEGDKWISFKTATNIASEKCNVVDSEEFKTLLNFLHDKRILIHFDDTPELNELVVLDPQWLIDVFKKVITVKPYDRQGKKFTELWRKLENKGILDEKLLEQVWGPLFDDRATCEKLLQIMGKFSLLCPWPSSDSLCGKQYLVPAMLKTHPPEDIMKLIEVASKTTPPLFLKFESGQVPPGLFPRLVLLLLQCGEEIFLSPERTKLFHNFARFFTSEEDNWSVILLCLSSSIKVVVHRENPIHESEEESLLSADASYGISDVTFPCEVHRLLGKILESMRNEFCWLKYMRYQVSFICPVCCQGGAVRHCYTHHVQDCKYEECLHFWSFSQLYNAKRIISCTKAVAALSNRVPIAKFAPWFTTQESQLTADQQDGVNLASVEGPVGKRKRESPGSSCVKHPKRTRSDMKQRTDSACTSLKRLHLTPGRPVNRAGPVGKRKRESPGSSCVKHPKRTHAVKEGSPEKDDLERLANQIINEWRKLGRRLLESDEALLDAVHKDNEECSEKAYKMLLKWKEAKGSEATFRVLHDALCHDLVKRQDLAEKFCRVNDH